MGAAVDSLRAVEAERVLKSDLFGRIVLAHSRVGGAASQAVIRREIQGASIWVRWLAQLLLSRESRALALLRAVPGVPVLLHQEKLQLTRSCLEGQPMQKSPPLAATWFDEARLLLVRCHRRGVVHNDAAKEPNWLVLEDGRPGLVDFQLASVHPRRGRIFRSRGREDLRHLLKHKRTYFPEALTARELGLLARPSLSAKIWRRVVKPVYHFVTRRLLGWQDREGAGDRSWSNP